MNWCKEKSNLFELCILWFKSTALYARCGSSRVSAVQFLMKDFTERPVLRGRIKMFFIRAVWAQFTTLFTASHVLQITLLLGQARAKRIQPKTLQLNYVALFSALAGRLDLICRPTGAATRFAVIYTCQPRWRRHERALGESLIASSISGTHNKLWLFVFSL